MVRKPYKLVKTTSSGASFGKGLQISADDESDDYRSNIRALAGAHVYVGRSRHTADLVPSSGTKIFALSGDIMEAAQGLRRADAAVRPARAERARANIDGCCSEVCYGLSSPGDKNTKRIRRGKKEKDNIVRASSSVMNCGTQGSSPQTDFTILPRAAGSTSSRPRAHFPPNLSNERVEYR